MSERIRKLASYVRPDSVLYDLCCDHGYIGLSAWDSRPLQGLIFVDQSANALRALHAELNSRKLTNDPRIKVRVCSGESIVLRQQPCDIIVAGVGNRTIVTILDKLCPKGLGQHRWILCPEKNSRELRCYLQDKGYGLVAEDVVMDAGRFREILVVEARGAPIHMMGEGFEQRSEPIFQNFVASLRTWHAGIDKKREEALGPQRAVKLEATQPSHSPAAAYSRA